MPRKKVVVLENDWRSAAQRKEDARLQGCWYRCRVHGLLGPLEVVHLGEVTYCGDLECSEAVLLAHSAMQDKTDAREWNGSITPQKRSRKAVNGARRPSPTREETPSDEPEDEEDDVADETQERTVPEIILAHLEASGGSARTGELRDAIVAERGERSGKWGQVSSTLGALRRRGQVRSVERGVWQLVLDDEEDEDEAPRDDAAADQVEEEPVEAEGSSEPEAEADDSGDDACAGTPAPTAPAATSDDAAPKGQPMSLPPRVDGGSTPPPPAQDQDEDRVPSRPTKLLTLPAPVSVADQAPPLQIVRIRIEARNVDAYPSERGVLLSLEIPAHGAGALAADVAELVGIVLGRVS